MQKFTTRSPEETKALATRLVETLASRSGTQATSTIVALQGNLGAGKTVFVKGVAKALGVTDEVTSPTFVIEKIYHLPEGGQWKRLVHIDAYRMEGEEELKTIGWQDIATDPGNLIMIEWPEQVGLGIPERAVWLEFETVDENTRAIATSIDIPDNTTNHA
jgi:tRNA threonylcarbamoyladenosine biosynthesis protein TsaE